jgi:hypothetical protein
MESCQPVKRLKDKKKEEVKWLPSSLVYGLRRFGGICHHYLQLFLRHKIPPKLRSSSARLHDVSARWKYNTKYKWGTLDAADYTRCRIYDGCIVCSVLFKDAASCWIYSVSDRLMKCECRLLVEGYLSWTTEVLEYSFIRHELCWNCGILLELWWIPWDAYCIESSKE